MRLKNHYLPDLSQRRGGEKEFWIKSDVRENFRGAKGNEISEGQSYVT